MAPATLIACHECDLLQREVPLAEGDAARCRRCGALLHRKVPDSRSRTLAYSLAAAILFLLANAFPIVGLDAQGRHTSTTLLGTVRTLHEQDMTSVALLVFVTTMLMPALQLAAMLYLLAPLSLGRLPRGIPTVFRIVQAVRPWGMMEGLLLGTLVSLAKLADLASLMPDIALWSFAALMLALAAAAQSFDDHAFWALLLAACILYVPANVLPVMETGSLFGAQRATIMSGIIYLWVGLLAALVQFEVLGTIRAGSGAIAFGAVVVLTMFAAEAFDPRLIWDPLDREDAGNDDD